MPPDNARVFLREVVSRSYGLAGQRRRQLGHPRVRGPEVSVVRSAVGYEGVGPNPARWVLAPGDEDFLTQTLQVHFGKLEPGQSNEGHGHQNEALFYVLSGSGHEIHDEREYAWKAGDLVIVHNDSVHRHLSAEASSEAARFLVFKAKSLYIYLGLLQQGRRKAFDAPGYGKRRSWSELWSADAEGRKKVVGPDDGAWTETPEGRVRQLTGPARPDVRAYSVDLAEQVITEGGQSSAHWHMADEVLYVLSGRGKSRQWQVEAEIAERYYARIADEPRTFPVGAGDICYVPQNTVHQLVNVSSEPLCVLSAQNRAFKMLGYDRTVFLAVHGDEIGELCG